MHIIPWLFYIQNFRICSISSIWSYCFTLNSHLGWFAWDPKILNRVGRVLLQLPDDASLVRPSRVIFAEDCLQLSSIPSDRITQGLVKSVEKLFGGG